MTELPKLVEETIKFYIDYPPVPWDDIVVPDYELFRETKYGKKNSEIIYGWKYNDLEHWEILYRILVDLKIMNISSDELMSFREMLIDIDYDDETRKKFLEIDYDETRNKFFEIFHDLDINNNQTRYGFVINSLEIRDVYIGLRISQKSNNIYGNIEHEISLPTLHQEIQNEKETLDYMTKFIWF